MIVSSRSDFSLRERYLAGDSDLVHFSGFESTPVPVLYGDDPSHPKIFLGGRSAIESPIACETLNAKVIVSIVANLGEALNPRFPRSGTFLDYEVIATPSFIPPGVRRFSLNSFEIKDHSGTNAENLVAAFEVFNEILERFNGEPIILHCSAGSSRSPLFLAGFIARHTGISLMDAIEEIAAKGKNLCINVGLLRLFAEALGIPLIAEEGQE